MRKIAVLFLIAALGLGSLASIPGWAQAQTSSGTSKSSGGARSATGTHSSYDHALLTPASLKVKAPEIYQVKFTTTKGDFTIEVTRSWAPLGADRFYNLVRHHFYNNASFFRVLPNFVVQFGLSAYPAVSAAWSKATIDDDPVTQSNLKGYITFATAGPKTRTTQVFINLADNKRLDGMGFAPFGKVTEGMSVVESFYEGYGEGAPQGAGPSQDEIEKEGKPYLDKGFPKLDSIKTATIISPTGTKPASTAGTSKPAAKPVPAADSKSPQQ